MNPAILYIDNSTLKAVAACSTEALVRYGFDRVSTEERAPLKSGAAGHEAMAEYFRMGDATRALDVFEWGAYCGACAGQGSTNGASCVACEGLGRVTPSYREWAEANVPLDDRLGYDNTSRILAAWFDRHPRNMLPFNVEAQYVEVGFAYPLLDEDTCLCGHRFEEHMDSEGLCASFREDCSCTKPTLAICTGRLDAIATDPQDGGWYVIENKFPGQINATFIKRYRMDSQLSTYAWAAQQHTGLEIKGSILNAVEFSRLPSSDRKCKDHAVTYAECGSLHVKSEMLRVDRTPEQIVQWHKTAIHLARKFRDLLAAYPRIGMIDKVRMQGTFNGLCTFCALYDWCSVGRPTDDLRLNAMLVKEPWSPFAYATGQRLTTTAHKP